MEHTAPRCAGTTTRGHEDESRRASLRSAPSELTSRGAGLPPPALPAPPPTAEPAASRVGARPALPTGSMRE